MHRHCDGTNKLLAIAICCATNSYQEEFDCIQKQECF